MEEGASVLAQILRIGAFTALLGAAACLVPGVFDGAQSSRLRLALVVAVLASAGIAVEYALFVFPRDLAEARAGGSASAYYYYNLSAAVVFGLAQWGAAVRAARGEREYLAWLLPALGYVLLIGLVGLVGFGHWIALPADLLRVAAILALVLAHERARARGARDAHRRGGAAGPNPLE